MPSERLLFADAESGFEDAEFVIFGVPFDGTTSHRTGSASAPASIRKESYNFETYIYEYKTDLEEISIHDAGDLSFPPSIRTALEKVFSFMKHLSIQEKFPVMLGGEHSLTTAAVKGLLSAYPDENTSPFGVIVLDAHLDYRNEYENERFSHACVTRRLTELIGNQNVIPIGVRSMGALQRQEAEELGLKYYDTQILNEMGMRLLLEDVIDLLGKERYYLSIDMDVLDPAYAPGVGNPEPFGITTTAVKECIEFLAPHLVGLDIMEVSPPYDNGNTASLAARFVRSAISLINTKKK